MLNNESMDLTIDGRHHLSLPQSVNNIQTTLLDYTYVVSSTLSRLFGAYSIDV